MLAKTTGYSVYGVDAHAVTIEVNVIQGTKVFMVGLPDNAVKESEQRIESALKHCGYELPRQKTVINLAPADVRKEGSAFDLPMALCILESSKQMHSGLLEKYAIMGELALDGTLRPIKGVLPIAIQARKDNLIGLILPKENSQEAAIVNNLDVIGVNSFKEAIDFLEGKITIQPEVRDTRDIFYSNLNNYLIDFSEVQGHASVKRALEVAASGGHNVIMVGPPGSGKTMLARRFPTILPPLSLQEALETTKIHSVAGKLDSKSALITTRPFNSPHHTISDVALIGGGSFPQPGQVSLSHNGVLFLDELPEFKRTVLEVLRQPLEDKVVTISRAKGTVIYPANFMLIASMNPSPSGDFYDPNGNHPDSPIAVQKYLSKISGPLLDRIDLHIEVNPVSFDSMTSGSKNETSEEVRNRVIKTREIQIERFKDVAEVHSNALMTPKMVKEYCKINPPCQNLLKVAVEKLKLSSRAYDRILKVSRTIADMAGVENIGVEHIAEAIQYRNLDREGWYGK